MNYLFILGRDPDLSLLELECYFESKNIEYKFLDYNKEVAVLSLPKLDFNKLIMELGGTIKIAEVFSSSENLSEIEYDFKNLQVNLDKKIDYSVSYYNTTLFEFIKDIIKDKFKKERVKAIYKKPKRKTDRFLTPTELIDRKIITNGLDIVIYRNFVAKTIAVYNPYEMGKRDLDRPNKDFLKTTSLRLAKILVNLSGAKENSWLLDPFCGTATILQEALLKNINVVGVDLDGNSVRDSIENLKWLKNTYNLSGKISIFEGDAANLTRTIKNKVDTIVCEPYMGPFLSREPSKEQAFQIIRNLKFIYTRFFNEAYKILDKNGRLVIIMPEISGISINPLNLTGDFMLYEPRLPLKLPIPYVLKNNKIKRYIYILEPK
ncbi:methyltransferase domain-containing protein [Candidatus Woesearchaeota archaeon]|nr:methyltransferase domain-containing protein [Candidatus Woesearchaeota archaeon]